MKPKDIHTKLAQRIIGTDDDGDFATDSIIAAKKWLGSWNFQGNPTPFRYVAAIIQRAAKAAGINPGIQDAYWGPQTEDAAYRLLGDQHIGWRPDEKEIVSPHELSKVKCWTPTDAQMIAKYGKVGSNQVVITLPFRMRLAWDLDSTTIRMSCHKLVADSLSNALEAVLAHYGIDAIRDLRLDITGGCLNVRLKRGGRTWSAHSWGTALDTDPDRNRLAWKKDRAVFAKPEYSFFFQAFAAQGWMSLGTCYNFDWMHVQKNP